MWLLVPVPSRASQTTSGRAAHSKQTPRAARRARARYVRPREEPGQSLRSASSGCAACRRRNIRRRRRARAVRSARTDRGLPGHRNPASTRTRPPRPRRRQAPRRLSPAGSACTRRRGRQGECRPCAAPRQTARRRQYSSAWLSVLLRPSPLKMSAGAVSRRRSTFSAKFRRASGKNCAPGILSRSWTTRSPIAPRTSQKVHTSRQKSAVRSIEKRRSDS